MFLLDTCTLLWLTADHTRLSEEVVRLLIRHPDQIFVSAISAFEIGTKHRKGKLELPMEPDRSYEVVLRFHQLTEIPVDGQIAARSTQLPRLHADPCDRMIVATAQLMQLTVLTPDALIQTYPETRVLW